MLRYKIALLAAVMLVVGLCVKYAMNIPTAAVAQAPARQPGASDNSGAAAPKAPATQPVVATPRPPSLSATQEKATLEFIKQQRPDFYPDLLKLKLDNPRRYRSNVGKWHGVMTQMQRLPKARAEAAANEKERQVEIARFVQAIRIAGDKADRHKLKQALRAKIEEHFQAEQRNNELYLDYLEMRLENVRREIRLRQRQREQIIDDRVDLWMRATTPAVRPATSPKGVPSAGE